MRIPAAIRTITRYVVLVLTIPLLFLSFAGAYSTHDFDNDGLSNTLEEEYGSDIRVPDSDKDGFMDGEEVFDLGTDPKVATNDIFSELERVNNIRYKIFSISSTSTVVGTKVYIKGVADVKKEQIELTYVADVQGSEVTFTSTFQTDHRGVFSGQVSLAPLCGNVQSSNVIMSIIAESHVIVDTITVACFQEDETSRVVSDVTLGGVALDPNAPPMHVRSKDVTLGLSLAPGYELRAAFASLVFSSSFLADSAERMVSFSSILELEPGEHTVTYYVIDPERRRVYPPVVIPFLVDNTEVMNLKAELPLSQWVFLPVIALLVPLFAGLIRFMQRKRDI